MASLWYKAHVDLPDHPKTSAAAYILGIDADLLVGKLYRLWSWALCNREDGFFAKHEIPLIAEKMRWKKSEKKLMEALLNVPKGENAGFITEAEGGYQLYNWHKYAGKLIENRKNEAERKAKKAKEIRQNSGGNSGGNPAENPQENNEDSGGNSAEVPRAKSKSKSKSNIYPPLTPHGGYDDDFSAFWQAYPKKVGKGAAEKAFKKIRGAKQLLPAMLSAIAVQAKTDQWQRDNGQYIPNPSTWLNQRRWEDEAPRPRAEGRREEW